MSESEEMKRLWELVKEHGLEDVFMVEIINALERHEKQLEKIEEFFKSMGWVYE